MVNKEKTKTLLQFSEEGLELGIKDKLTSLIDNFLFTVMNFEGKTYYPKWCDVYKKYKTEIADHLNGGTTDKKINQKYEEFYSKNNENQ